VQAGITPLSAGNPEVGRNPNYFSLLHVGGHLSPQRNCFICNRLAFASLACISISVVALVDDYNFWEALLDGMHGSAPKHDVALNLRYCVTPRK
jgi:hypothetical protein